MSMCGAQHIELCGVQCNSANLVMLVWRRLSSTPGRQQRHNGLGPMLLVLHALLQYLTVLGWRVLDAVMALLEKDKHLPCNP